MGARRFSGSLVVAGIGARAKAAGPARSRGAARSWACLGTAPTLGRRSGRRSALQPDGRAARQCPPAHDECPVLGFLARTVIRRLAIDLPVGVDPFRDCAGGGDDTAVLPDAEEMVAGQAPRARRERPALSVAWSWGPPRGDFESRSPARGRLSLCGAASSSTAPVGSRATPSRRWVRRARAGVAAPHPVGEDAALVVLPASACHQQRPRARAGAR